VAIDALSLPVLYFILGKLSSHPTLSTSDTVVVETVRNSCLSQLCQQISLGLDSMSSTIPVSCGLDSLSSTSPVLSSHNDFVSFQSSPGNYDYVTTSQPKAGIL